MTISVTPSPLSFWQRYTPTLHRASSALGGALRPTVQGLAAAYPSTPLGKLTAQASRFQATCWKNFKTHHEAIRIAGGAIAINDLAHHGTLATWPGFVGALLACNAVYSKVIGKNVFGLDTAAPLSMASYFLFRSIAGARMIDFAHLNFIEMLGYRYILEFGNVIQSIATYGRSYIRPDMRQDIAVSRGLEASKETGTATPSVFGRTYDFVIGGLFRFICHAASQWPYTRWIDTTLRKVFRPVVAMPMGRLLQSAATASRWGKFKAALAAKTVIIESFDNNDMMKPKFGPLGRFVSLAQNCAYVVPYQLFVAPLLGMSAGAWGPNRTWKMTLWSFFGNPLRARLGGDTPRAELGGFALGLTMDLCISMFYNPRADKHEWKHDLQDTATAAQAVSGTSAEQAAIDPLARHFLDDIVQGQMAEWSVVSLVSGNGLLEYKEAYFENLDAELLALTPAQQQGVTQMVTYLNDASYHNALSKTEDIALAHLRQRRPIQQLVQQ